mgnify:FL=1
MHTIWPTHLLLYRSAAAMQKAAACMLLPSLHRARSSRWNVSISKLTCSAHNTHQTAHSSMPRAHQRHEVEHGREQRNDARKAILCYTSQLSCEAPCHFFPPSILLMQYVRNPLLTHPASMLAPPKAAGAAGLHHLTTKTAHQIWVACQQIFNQVLVEILEVRPSAALHN